MATAKPSFLSYDPDVAGISGATGETSGGGKLIAAGTWYSKPTRLGFANMFSDQISFAGTLAGTLVVQASNASDEDIAKGIDQWDDDSSVTPPAVATNNAARTIDVDTLDFVRATGSTLSAVCATTGPLPAVTAAGTGVGKTLTANAVGALVIDGVTPALNDAILVKNQVNAVDNGLYTLTTVGTAGVAFVLTRATTMDATGAETTPGRSVAVAAGGTANGLTSWIIGGVPHAFMLILTGRAYDRCRLKFTRSGGEGQIKSRRAAKAT